MTSGTSRDVRTSARADGDALNWLFVVSILVVAGLHLSLALMADSGAGGRFFVLGLLLLVVPLVYVTPLWEPVFYLVEVLALGVLGTVWVLDGMQYFALGAVTYAVAAGSVLLATYLFVRESGPSPLE